MKIAFVSGKGGVGKSTLCYLTGLSLRDAGKTVSIDDRDPQRSVSSWIDHERDGFTAPGAQFNLIDTRPALDDQSVSRAIQEADRVIMPCTPSPADITSARATIEVVRSLMREGARAYVVLNMTKPGTNFSAEAPEMLRSLSTSVMNTEVPERQCIQRAVLLGWRALDSRTQGTILKLTLEVLS